MTFVTPIGPTAAMLVAAISTGMTALLETSFVIGIGIGIGCGVRTEPVRFSTGTSSSLTLEPQAVSKAATASVARLEEMMCFMSSPCKTVDVNKMV
jgi:hypothetical protein